MIKNLKKYKKKINNGGLAKEKKGGGKRVIEPETRGDNGGEVSGGRRNFHMEYFIKDLLRKHVSR